MEMVSAEMVASRQAVLKQRGYKMGSLSRILGAASIFFTFLGVVTVAAECSFFPAWAIPLAGGVVGSSAWIWWMEAQAR